MRLPKIGMDGGPGGSGGFLQGKRRKAIMKERKMGMRKRIMDQASIVCYALSGNCCGIYFILNKF